MSFDDVTAKPTYFSMGYLVGRFSIPRQMDEVQIWPMHCLAERPDTEDSRLIHA